MNSLNLAPIQSILLWDTKERSIFLNTYPTISLNFQGKPAVHEWKHSSQRAARGACVCDSGVSRHQQWQIWSWVNGTSPRENLRLPRGEPQDERNINLHLGLSCNSLSEAELPWAGSKQSWVGGFGSAAHLFTCGRSSWPIYFVNGGVLGTW